jgi:hypothetical protein
MFWNKITIVSIMLLGFACDSGPTRPMKRSGGGGANFEPGGTAGSPNPSVVIGADGKPIKVTGMTAIGLVDQSTASSFPRLSHLQWENSVRDLLRLSATSGESKNFPVDPSGSAYGNNGSLYSVTNDHWTAYRNAAENLGTRIGTDAAAYKKLIPAGKSDTKSIVSSFLKRAYRRLPTDAEVNAMVTVFNNGPKLTSLTDAQGAGFCAMISVVLQSPNFLYRVELGTDTTTGKYVALDAFEVASRLSYAIWNTMPDDTLLELAESGEILKTETLKAQATRLMDDPRGAEILKTIHMQAYHVDQFVAVKQDAKNYPEAANFDTATLQQEASLFVNDVVVTQGKGITELFTAPYAYVSSKTAAAYEVTVTSAEPKKTDLDPTKRAGLMTQVAFLSNYSKGEGLTSIIKRGHYVAETVLCASFKGAPPSVEDTSPKDFKTNRERVHALTSVGSCAGCHNSRINPPGFALENLGPGGKWRTLELNNSPIDATGSYVFNDETINFDGPVALMKEIVHRPDLHQCYAQKLIEALYGRYADAGDRILIEKLGTASLQGMSPKDIFLYILSDGLITVRSK